MPQVKTYDSHVEVTEEQAHAVLGLFADWCYNVDIEERVRSVYRPEGGPIDAGYLSEKVELAQHNFGSWWGRLDLDRQRFLTQMVLGQAQR